MLIYFCTIKIYKLYYLFFEILYEVINYVDLFCIFKNSSIMLIYFVPLKITNYVYLFLNH